MGNGFLNVGVDDSSTFLGIRESLSVNGVMTGTNTIADISVSDQNQSLFGATGTNLSGTFVADTSLPSMLPDPLLFDVTAGLGLDFLDGITNQSGSLHTTSLSNFGLVSSVPLPPDIVFLGTGLVIVGHATEKPKVTMSNLIPIAIIQATILITAIKHRNFHRRYV